MRPGIGYLIAVTVTVAVLSSQVAQACLSPYGFLDFEPQPLVAPGGDVEMGPVDVSASTVDDMNQLIISYKEDLYVFWVKETGTTEVSENIGDLQRLYVHLGAVCIVFGAIISLVDVFQHRRDNP